MLAKALFFFVTEIMFAVLFLLLKKTDHKQSFLLWFTLSVITLMAINAFVQGLLNLFHLPVGILSMSTVLLAVDTFIAFLLKNGRQAYFFDRQEKIFLSVLTAATVFFWFFYFGPDLSIRFASVDASVHARYAKFFAFHHKFLTNLFFSAVNDGLLMEALSFFGGPGGFYHIFVFMRVFDLFLAGLVFYVCAERFMSAKKTSQIALLLMVLLYTAGYPLYGVIFGFAYYLDVITLAGYLYLVLRNAKENKMNKRLSGFMISMGLFGTMVSYTMLVPVIWCFVFVNIILILRKAGKMNTSENVCFVLFVFGIPAAIGMSYAWVNLKEMNPYSGAISHAGGAYFNLFSNFVLLIPFIAGEVVKEIKEKRISLEMNFLLFSFLYWLIFFAFYEKGTVSQYYFSKVYNLLWLCAWIVTAKAIGNVQENKKNSVSFYLLSEIGLFGICAVTNRIYRRNENQLMAEAESVLNIDVFNASMMKNVPEYPDDLIHLYEHAADLHTRYVIGWAPEDKGQWFITFTDTEFYYPRDDINEYLSWADGTKSEYFCVTYEKAHDQNLQILESMGNVIYRNSAGELIRRRD